MSTPGPVTKHWLGFSYIRSEYYELDPYFYLTEMKRKQHHSSNDKSKLFCKNIVVIEGEFVDDMNLTDGAIFPMAMIKRAKSILNQKIPPHVTKTNGYAKLI